MTRQDAEKWALLLKFASDNYRVDASVFEKHLLEQFPEPQPQNDALLRCVQRFPQMQARGAWTCEACKKSYVNISPSETFCNGAEQPPDVSHLRFEGLRVEIAEPIKRHATVRDIWLYDFNPKPENWRARRYDGITGLEYWILRTIPEPQSVYGCDPKDVSLEGKLSPNGKPVRRVQVEWFREPVSTDGGLYLGFDGYIRPSSKWTCGPWCNCGMPDKRRIIVEEIPEPLKKSARRWICMGDLSESHELPSLEDPKVLDDLRSQCSEAWSGTFDIAQRERQYTKAVIEAYMKMGVCK